MKVRRSSDIWLVGHSEERFSVAKLPSKREVIKVLFSFHDDKKMTLKHSVKETVNLVLPIWERARIPTTTEIHVRERLARLHKEWQALKKNKNRFSSTENNKRSIFSESLDDLFDIAHQDAMNLIKIKEDRSFLAAQREKGRRGSMVGADMKLANKEMRIIERAVSYEKHKEKHKISDEICNYSAATANISSEESSSSDRDHDDYVPEVANKPCSSTHSKRANIKVVTPEVAAALDRTLTTSRSAAHVFSAMASSNLLKDPTTELQISHRAIHRARNKHRESLAAEIQAEIQSSFDPNVPLTLHWDGKIMSDYTGNVDKTVDRLAILVSGKDISKLLAVPKLNAGNSSLLADACLSEMRNWGLENRIVALCFDTTATNTGVKGGVCLKIETELQRDLLNLACRHHISEIILDKVFSLHDTSKSPNIEMFGKFREYWPHIDKSLYKTVLNNSGTNCIIQEDKREALITFAIQELQAKQPRGDYQELLELSIIFLGGTPPQGINFRKPGAIHRARWMARAIYALKMCLFQEQFSRQYGESSSRGSRFTYAQSISNHLLRVSLFVTTVYIKYWFTCTSPNEAPRNDLMLLKILETYPDKEVSTAALTAFSRHLWYLSEILVGLSFFDNEVSPEDKRVMIQNMKERQGSEEPPKRIPPIKNPSSCSLADFVTTSTQKFFNILRIDKTFFNKDPTSWHSDQTYIEAIETVSSLRVTNDLAERGVALMQSFNEGLTRNEEQKQFVLQVVECHRKKFAQPRKNII